MSTDSPEEIERQERRRALHKYLDTKKEKGVIEALREIAKTNASIVIFHTPPGSEVDIT